MVQLAEYGNAAVNATLLDSLASSANNASAPYHHPRRRTGAQR
jgi:hypothetical protein